MGTIANVSDKKTQSGIDTVMVQDWMIIG